MASMKTSLTVPVPYGFLTFFLLFSLLDLFSLLSVSMVLSDTCVNDPNERVKAVLKYYLGNGLATDYVMEFVEHWMSRKWYFIDYFVRISGSKFHPAVNGYLSSLTPFLSLFSVCSCCYNKIQIRFFPSYHDNL